MSKQPRLARDHTLSEAQWDQLDADFDKAVAAAEEAKAKEAAAEKPETKDGT